MRGRLSPGHTSIRGHGLGYGGPHLTQQEIGTAKQRASRAAVRPPARPLTWACPDCAWTITELEADLWGQVGRHYAAHNIHGRDAA